MVEISQLLSCVFCWPVNYNFRYSRDFTLEGGRAVQGNRPGEPCTIWENGPQILGSCHLITFPFCLCLQWWRQGRDITGSVQTSEKLKKKELQQMAEKLVQAISHYDGMILLIAGNPPHVSVV